MGLPAHVAGRVGRAASSALRCVARRGAEQHHRGKGALRGARPGRTLAWSLCCRTTLSTTVLTFGARSPKTSILRAAHPPRTTARAGTAAGLLPLGDAVARRSAATQAADKRSPPNARRPRIRAGPSSCNGCPVGTVATRPSRRAARRRRAPGAASSSSGRVDLADAALGDAEDLADLGQRHVLDVEQDGDLALAAREAGEGARGSGPWPRSGRRRAAGPRGDRRRRWCRRARSWSHRRPARAC